MEVVIERKEIQIEGTWYIVEQRIPSSPRCEVYRAIERTTSIVKVVKIVTDISVAMKLQTKFHEMRNKSLVSEKVPGLMDSAMEQIENKLYIILSFCNSGTIVEFIEGKKKNEEDTRKLLLQIIKVVADNRISINSLSIRDVMIHNGSVILNPLRISSIESDDRMDTSYLGIISYMMLTKDYSIKDEEYKKQKVHIENEYISMDNDEEDLNFKLICYLMKSTCSSYEELKSEGINLLDPSSAYFNSSILSSAHSIQTDSYSKDINNEYLPQSNSSGHPCNQLELENGELNNKREMFESSQRKRSIMKTFLEANDEYLNPYLGEFNLKPAIIFIILYNVYIIRSYELIEPEMNSEDLQAIQTDITSHTNELKRIIDDLKYHVRYHTVQESEKALFEECVTSLNFVTYTNMYSIYKQVVGLIKGNSEGRDYKEILAYSYMMIYDILDEFDHIESRSTSESTYDICRCTVLLS